jgi:hypothetical protein
LRSTLISYNKQPRLQGCFVKQIRNQGSSQSMKSTAALRCKFSVFAFR